METPQPSRGGAGWILAGLVAAGVALGGWLWMRPSPAAKPPEPPAPPAAEQDDAWMKETQALMAAGRHADARDRLQEVLGALPRHPILNVLMGQCLMGLKSFDRASGHFETALAADHEAAQVVPVWLGISLLNTGRAARALSHLEKPCGVPALEEARALSLTECYLYLERYEDVLRNLPDEPGLLWARHRALVYQGKGAEAAKLVEGLPPRQRAYYLAGQLREDGDFAGALRVLEEGYADAPPDGPDRLRLRRGELSVALESGDAARIEKVSAELAGSDDPAIRGEAIYARSLGHLLAGRGDAARAGAWEFLAKTDPDYSPLRFERLAMRFLAGELKAADLEAEAKEVSRFHANDLYGFLALATGDAAWAEKGLASTPGHNYPYHTLKRLLAK